MAQSAAWTDETPSSDEQGYPPHPYLVLKLTWTSAADGTVTSTSNVALRKLYGIETNPGSTTPTAAYDVTVETSRGAKLASARNRSSSETEFEPVDGSISEGAWIAGFPIVKITGAGDSKTGVLYLVGEK